MQPPSTANAILTI